MTEDENGRIGRDTHLFQDRNNSLFVCGSRGDGQVEGVKRFVITLIECPESIFDISGSLCSTQW